MLKPKASHLVERVAEKLLRSGALEDSAAQLMDPELPVATSPVLGLGAPVLDAMPPVARVPRAARPNPSSLFAPKPDPSLGPPLGMPKIRLPLAQGQPRTDGNPVAGAFEGRPRQVPVSDAPDQMAAPAILTPHALRPEERSDPDSLQSRTAVDAVALERGGMVDWSRTRSRISEEFRLVQRQILRTAFGPGSDPGFSNLLMVTSARPGEGKSFTSVNLAGSIARQGDHHVLLVDADSKRDSFCYSLGLAESRGLLDLVANPKLDPAPLIVRTPIERLSILPVGRERERSAELFSTKEMTRLIQSLGRRYADRLLLLDAPPCLSTSDPAVLAPVVGQIVFVVEADRTQRDEVEASLDLIQACPTITLVLNKQQISSRYTFGAYSSYYSS